MDQDYEADFVEDCDEVNPTTNTTCGRGSHYDGYHWHDADDGDPLPLLYVAWQTDSIEVLVQKELAYAEYIATL